MSTLSHLKLSLQISGSFRVHLYTLTYGQEYYFDSIASHSFIDASYVEDLGLEVETLEEPLHVSSP